MQQQISRRHLIAGASLVSLLSGSRAFAADPAAPAPTTPAPAVGPAAAPTPASATAGAPLELVATFTAPHQVTGVAVSKTGRIFVNFPRWEEDVAISVAEVGKDGQLTAYPNAAWNAFRNANPDAAQPGSSFVCVQSVTVDKQDRLWVLDPAAPGLGFEVTGGPKLVCIDLHTNTVKRVYRFGTDIAPQGSYLNDIRFTDDGKRAVLTNSGVPGCLVTFDVETGHARRVLDGDPSTQFEKGVQMVIDGRTLSKLDGEPPHFSADGILLDNHGNVLWQATTGTTIYRVPVAALFDRSMSPASLAAKVAVVTKGTIADGYWFSSKSGMLITDPVDHAVRRLNPDHSFTVLAQDPRLNWPDSMAEGPDGAIYVTASHIPDMKTWQGPGISQTELFRFHPQ